MAEAVAVASAIPEFNDPPDEREYHKRLDRVPHLILVAEQGGIVAGFKAGYERDGGFYSWIGGVLPPFRRAGIAGKLAEAQEIWARQKGYATITFKTRNQHKGMLIFALRNGFDIVGFTPQKERAANRILLQKCL